MYQGTVSQQQVDALAPHLAKDNNTGRVLAEQLLREPQSRAALLTIFKGLKPRAELEHFLPFSVITEKPVTSADVGAGS